MASHGQLTSCVLVGSTWVVIAVHPSGPAEIGTYGCSLDTSCLDGWNTHDLSLFGWQSAPAGTELEIFQDNGHVLVLYDGETTITYDVDTRTFDVDARAY